MCIKKVNNDLEKKVNNLEEIRLERSIVVSHRINGQSLVLTSAPMVEFTLRNVQYFSGEDFLITPLNNGNDVEIQSNWLFERLLTLPNIYNPDGTLYVPEANDQVIENVTSNDIVSQNKI